MPRYDIIKILTQTTGSIRQLGTYNPLTIHKKGTRTKAIFALSMVCILWGTTWVAAKKGVEHMPAMQLVSIRQLIGGICYVAFFLAKGTSLPKGKEWISIIVLSILNFICSNGLSTWGIKYISAGLGAIMGAIFPLWLVVIGLFSAKSKIPNKAIIGLLMGFSGVCIIFYEHLKDFSIPDFRFGIIISLIATWTWAFGTLYTKRHAASFNPYFSLGLQMLISGITLFIFTKATNSPTVQSFMPLTEIPLVSWLSILYLVIFGSIIAFICYLYALQNLPTEQASVYAYVNPVVAVLIGWALFSEHLTVFIAAGGAVALLGVYLVNKAFKVIPAVEQPEAEGV